MDYYNIDLFDEIDQDTLITNFEDGTLIESGNIDVYGDTVGRPGDIFYDLASIATTENSIIFNFGKSSVEVHNPKGIVVNKYVIGIKSAARVDWNWSDEEKLIYEDGDDGFETKAINQNHNFNINKKKPAFLLSTWGNA